MATPLLMPESFFSSVKFDLHRYMSGNMLKGGRTQTMEQAEPRWMADFTTGRLDETRRRLWSGFWVSLRGGLRDFVAYDPSRDYPLAYASFNSMVRAGGGSFTSGQAGVTAISPQSITIGGGASGLLPANFQLAIGDRFSLVLGDRYSLHELTATATGNAGGVITIASFEPRILTNIFTTSSVAVFFRPACVMTPDPVSWDLRTSAEEPPPVSFTGIQKLY